MAADCPWFTKEWRKPQQEEVVLMFAYKKHITIKDPNHLVLTHLPFRPGQRIEIVFLAEDDGPRAQQSAWPVLFKKTQSLAPLKTITEEDIAAELADYRRGL